MIIGESFPAEKKSGDEIIGGSINGEGLLKFKVNKVGDEKYHCQAYSTKHGNEGYENKF